GRWRILEARRSPSTVSGASPSATASTPSPRTPCFSPAARRTKPMGSTAASMCAEPGALDRQENEPETTRLFDHAARSGPLALATVAAAGGGESPAASSLLG